jgi:hypothetical protein
MYRWIRNTHLALGLSSALFVLLYALSAAQMAHRWPLTRQVADEDLALPAGLAARPLAAALMEQRGYHGELRNPLTTPAGIRMVIARPGARYGVNYDPVSGQAHVRCETFGFLAMMNQLHTLNGLHHADRTLNAWGWALLVFSLALIALGASGIYLWFRIHVERTIGALLLAANLAVSAGLLVALRL